MKPLLTSELFSVWEQSLDLPMLSRALLLLTKACGVHDIRHIEAMSIGERDARLLVLREWMFGKRMQHVSHCPACKEKVEWETNTTDLRVQNFENTPEEKILQTSDNAFEIKFRLINSRDIMEVMKDNPTSENISNKLLRNCIIEVNKDGEKMNKEEVPIVVLRSLENEMTKLDPQADIQMTLDCPACKHKWSVGFDIVSWFLTEINHWAKQMLQEVFLLARFFGWSEKDILNMTPRRRSLYLQMINA